MARGRLRIYLGAAPGVGKTYAMLEEGQRLRASGADVVAGFVEPHGRRPTAAMAEGLETVERRRVTHRGAEFTEMDLDTVLARRPQVALVDELAHTNVAGTGTRNAKRWQDVEELLDAGIDVVTTLNVQHLESLNDVVRQITGVRQRETLPDEVARRADQIELVDLPPEVLRRRLAHGAIYPPDRIEAALTHYFRVGNLIALRELALLWLADRVEEGLQRYRAEHGIAAPWETRERIMVGLTGGPEGETLIRRAARIAARTPGSELLTLHVVPADGLTHADPAALAAQRALVESLGGTYHQTTGESVVEALLQFARAENVTQIVLGASRRGRLSLLLDAGVGHRTIRGSGPIDVHVVTHEEAAGSAFTTRKPGPGRGAGPRRFWIATAGAALLLPALTLILTAPATRLDLSGVLVVFLVAVVVTALVGGLVPALAAAIAAAALADYYFTTPVHSLRVEHGGEVLALVGFVVTAALVGAATDAAARRTRQAVRATWEAQVLSRLASAMMHGRDLPTLIEQVRETFGLTAASLLERDPKASPGPRWYVVASAGADPPEQPYQADVESPVSDNLTLAARGSLATDDQRILGACAAQLGMAHLHGRLARHAAETDTLAAAERTHASLIRAADRDLRERLRTAEEALARRDTDTAQASIRRAAQVVADLADLDRLHGGTLDLYLRPVDLDEVLTAVLDDLGPGGRTIEVRLPEQQPDVIADAALLTRLLTALAADALRHSPPQRPPALTAEVLDGRLRIRLTGGPDGAPRPDSLTLRLSRDLTEAMGGTLEAADDRGRLFSVTLTLPAASTRP
ncbi:DUF4118 domain-containing protein [Streptomyces sp. H51]|uniref:DUF4118 domain-containing protein n=1 Tax=Streptomyces sp. H51 TaxID=3111770 RepID=UPI002D77A699|nr:DUF4118 domain-containing protein [Streptomyces sp. H51]